MHDVSLMNTRNPYRSNSVSIFSTEEMKLYKLKHRTRGKESYCYVMRLTKKEGEDLLAISTEFEIAHIGKEFIYLRPKKVSTEALKPKK